jgi:hypothetical protein
MPLVCMRDVVYNITGGAVPACSQKGARGSSADPVSCASCHMFEFTCTPDDPFTIPGTGLETGSDLRPSRKSCLRFSAQGPIARRARPRTKVGLPHWGARRYAWAQPRSTVQLDDAVEPSSNRGTVPDHQLDDQDGAGYLGTGERTALANLVGGAHERRGQSRRGESPNFLGSPLRCHGIATFVSSVFLFSRPSRGIQ